MSFLHKFGIWNEEGMSNDLGKNESFFNNWIEFYHNSESAGATCFNCKLLNWKKKNIYYVMMMEKA